MNRIDEAFTRLAGREGACLPFLVGGDPDLEASEEYALALVEGGADLIEIGIPFSDPVADGPTIQAAAQRALEQGVTPDQIFALLSRLRKQVSIPVILLTYYNLIFRRGEESFLTEASDAGADGIIVPDLPVEEADSLVARAEKSGMAVIFLATPATDEERLQNLVSNGSGFLYLVARYGVTGEKSELGGLTTELIQRVRPITQGELPLAVGFGLSTPDQVGDVIRAGADGAIVGSAIVRRIAEQHTPEKIAAFVRTLKQATLL